jgi:5-methylcytosine-specific restriction endonuclease McrA
MSRAKVRAAGVHLRPGMASWVIPAGGGAWLWDKTHDAGHVPGLLTAEVFCFIFWPLVLVLVLYCGPGLPLALVPWRARRWYRELRGGRPAIASWLRRGVLAADRHRCCYCGGRWELQLDHIRPWSLGGLSVLWNFAVLCGRCNRVKSNYWRFRSGHVVYRAWAGSADAALAERILAHEKRHRLNLARWVRAAWALGVI